MVREKVGGIFRCWDFSKEARYMGCSENFTQFFTQVFTPFFTPSFTTFFVALQGLESSWVDDARKKSPNLSPGARKISPTFSPVART